MDSTRPPKTPKSNPDLFYIDESSLSTTDEDEFLNLYETNTKPEEVVNPDFREAYRQFLEKNGYTFDV